MESGIHNVESRILICGALTVCMEKPEIPGRIQMERFIPFAVLPFTGSYRNDQNFPTICLDYPCQASCRKKVKNLPVFCKYKYMVSAHGL